MMQIEIHKASGERYRAAVPTLTDVANLADLASISHIIIYAITPREYKYYKSLKIHSKIDIIR